MDSNRKWYSEIVLLHCIGLLLVLSAHIAQANGFYYGGIGTPIFLFVAGFLAGIKKQPHHVSWLKKKALRVLLPYYFVLVVVLLVYIILKTEPFVFKQWLILFVNMQGLTNFLFYNDLTGYWAPLGQGLGHFWFVTIIMICFLTIPIIEHIFESRFWKKHQVVLIVAIVFIIQPILLYYNVQIQSVVVFFLGYLYVKNMFEINEKCFILITLVMLLFVVIRFVSRQFIDGSIIYDHYIAGLSNVTIGFWIVAFVFFLRNRFPATLDKIASWRVIVWLESIIYEFYLIHHIIIKGSWSFYKFGYNPILTTVVILVVTVCLSLLLKSVTNLLVSKVFKK